MTTPQTETVPPQQSQTVNSNNTLPTQSQPSALTYSEQQFQEAIAAARREAKLELTPQLSQLQDQLTNVNTQLEKAQQEREAEQARLQAEAEAAERARQEEELSAKELVRQQREQFERQIAEMKEEQQRQQAVWNKEREYQDLKSYIQTRVAQEKDEIAPELRDLIDGGTHEEVERSIATMKEKTASILEGVRQAQEASLAAAPGVSTNAGNVGIIENQGATRQYTAEEIAAIPPSSPEYARLRQQYGMDRAGRGQGMF